MALTRRQKQIHDFVREFIAREGYSPSLEEIGRHFGLSSVATVHKHVTNLVRKGLLRRAWNQNRSIEVVEEGSAPRAVEVEVAGRIAAARPIEAYDAPERLALPAWLVGPGRTYALRVEGDAMLGEHVRAGDLVVVEERRHAEPGQLVVAMVHGGEASIRRLDRDGDRLVLTPPHPAEAPTAVAADRVEVRGVVLGVIRKC